MGATTKLSPKQKRCCDCKKVKHKFNDFRSRWNRCQKHKEQGLAKDDKKVLACGACEEARSSTIRQPRCVDCDAKRGSKKTDKTKKKAAPAKVAAKKKAAKPSKAAPVVTAPPVADTVASTPPPASSPAPAPAPVHHTAPPASPPAPSGVASSIAAVDALLAEKKEETADSAGPAGPAPAVAASPSVKGKKPAMGEAAPQPAFRGPPPQGPRLIRRGAQGCSQGRHYIQTNIVEIKRILFALTTREKRVARAEVRLDAANDRFRRQVTQVKEIGGLDLASPQLRARYESAHTSREHEIARVNNAKAWREFTAKKLRLFLDHALSHTPYTGALKPCPDGPCEKCNNTGLARQENKNPYAKAAVPILRHIQRVLTMTEDCFKIRAGTSEKDDAYVRILNGHMGLVKKFGNPHQTAMEGDDAEQGARIGLLDAARRFDPTKPVAYICPGVTRTENRRTGAITKRLCGYKEKADLDRDCSKCKELGHRCDHHQSAQKKTCPKCGKKLMVQTSVAVFQTVAWSWAKRNSRARKTTDERPGLRPSIDDPALGGKKAEDGGVADQVTKIDGRAQIADASTKLDDNETAALDLHTQIAGLDDEQQRTVMGLCLEGLSPTEIGKELDLTTRQVVKVKEAACAILRERLVGYLPERETVAAD